MKSVLISGLLAALSLKAFGATETDIKIGAAFPMTGNIASYGQDNVNAIRLYLDEVNKNGGVHGKQISLINEDTRGEPIDAINSIKKLTGLDKVRVILGTPSSSNTLAIAPVAQKEGVTLLSPSGTSSKIPQVGNHIGHVCFTDEYQAEVMAVYAFEKLQKKKVAVIEDQSSDYSLGLSEAFQKKFKSLGGEITINPKYQQKDVDFRSLLLKVRKSQPDAIYIPGYYTEAGLIIRQARQMGIDLMVLGADGFDSPSLNKIGGDALDNVYFTTHFSPDDKNPVVQKFVEGYRKKYKETPSAQAALAYDAIGMVVSTLKESPLSFDDFSRRLYSIQNYQGVTGTISFLPDRNVKKEVTLIRIAKNENSFVERYAGSSANN